jgi:hypothetical protein
MQSQGDEQSLPKLAVDAIAAGGAVANLVAAAIAILRLRRNRGPARIGMEVISPQRLCARRSIWQPKAPVE